jgi:hypothetical protein
VISLSLLMYSGPTVSRLSPTNGGDFLCKGLSPKLIGYSPQTHPTRLLFLSEAPNASSLVLFTPTRGWWWWWLLILLADSPLRLCFDQIVCPALKPASTFSFPSGSLRCLAESSLMALIAFGAEAKPSTAPKVAAAAGAR